MNLFDKLKDGGPDVPRPPRKKIEVDASEVRVGDVLDLGPSKSRMLVEKVAEAPKTVVVTGIHCYHDGFVPHRLSPQRAQIKRGTQVKVARLIKGLEWSQTTDNGRPEWRAVDAKGRLWEVIEKARRHWAIQRDGEPHGVAPDAQIAKLRAQNQCQFDDALPD